MKRVVVGLVGDRSLDYKAVAKAITKNNTMQYIYNSLEGPIQITFRDYDECTDESYNMLLVILNGSKVLTEEAEKNLISKLMNRIPKAIVSIDKKHDKNEINSLEIQLNPEFVTDIFLNSGEGIDTLIYLISEYTFGQPNIIYDPTNSIRKFNKYLEIITPKRVVKFIPAKNTKVCRKATASFLVPANDNYEWTEFDNSNGYEFGQTRYDWFAFSGDIEVPSTYDSKKHLLHAKFNISRNYLVRPWDDDFPAGPEGRIWLNGAAIGAIDEFHNSQIIREGGHVETRIFTGRCTASHNLTQFGLEITDKNTDALYYRLKFMIALIKQMKENNNDRTRLIRLVDAAVRELDVRDLNGPIGLLPVRRHDPSDTAFYASVPKALAILRSISGIRSKVDPDGPCISIIGYSHLDTCWEWPYSILHFKSANTASSMLNLIENPPDEFSDPAEWKFLATASIHYKWMSEDDPLLYSRIMKAINDKRWVADGVTFLEHETVLMSGESMIRQFLYGKSHFENIVGQKQTTLILPDCFGFSACLPQVMRGFGIDSFLTSKISWCEYNDFPYHTFNWRGNDGSEVLAHFVTTPSSWSYQTSTYTGTATIPEICGTFDCYKQKDICRHSAIHMAGNGDGGGGITEEMVWNFNLFKELPRLEGVPAVKFPTMSEIFNEIRRKKSSLPTWDDELYLEYHRGTLTTQEEVKRQNRKLEAHLKNTEFILTVLMACFDYKDDKNYLQEIKDIWENCLLFQFHDALPGTSINEANMMILEKGQKALHKLKEIENELAQILADDEKSNLSISTVAPFYGWKSQDESKKDEYSTTFYERNRDESFTSMELNHSDEDTTESDKIEFDFQTKTVKTKEMTIKFNEFGGIASAVVNGREFIGESTNPFKLYEDRSINWPAWDIQLYHKDMELEPPVLVSISSKDDKEVELCYKVPTIGEGKADKTTIKQILTFKGTVVDMKTYVNWTQHDKLLKYVLPTRIRARTAKFGLQFGYLERETHKNTKRDMARFEASGRWADLSDSKGGITVMSDVKAGFDVHEKTMMLSLLKAPMQTDKWADFGQRRFIIRIDFHDEPFSVRAQKLSDSLVYPNTFAASKENKEKLMKEFVKIDDDKLILSALKVGEDKKSFVARFYEPSGGYTRAKIRFPLLKGGWEFALVNLEELNENPLEYNSSENSIEIEAEAFQIVTVMFRKIE